LTIALPARAEGDRNQWSIEMDLSAPSASTPLGSWAAGGLGKLRYDDSDRTPNLSRFVGEYRRRITPTIWGDVVADWADDGTSGLGITEAYIDWRPIPKSRIRHRWRFGAFYPPFSLENTGLGWSSPWTISSSAINTWFGEEIRTFGAEWSMHRGIGPSGSPQEFGLFAASFYGNDPAGTLLFWRGWSLHDRQSRLGDRWMLPPVPLPSPRGPVTGYVDNPFEPFHEIDGRPGVYGGAEWRYAQRALVQAAVYDNRADPKRFSGGQWGWHTRFAHVAAQVSLPARFGLMTQWLGGKTAWRWGGLSDGTVLPNAVFAKDSFESWYLLLTRPVFMRHSVSLRYDHFKTWRPKEKDDFVSDDGDAWTAAYRYSRSPTLSFILEWLDVDSARVLWPVYGLPNRAEEREVQLKVELTVGGLARR
jgi:hypothetical protein